MSKLGPNKKEFITYWTPEMVYAQTERMPIDQAKFFDVYESGRDGGASKAMIPTDIKFSDLNVFCGHKTKVTIEIIP